MQITCPYCHEEFELTALSFDEVKRHVFSELGKRSAQKRKDDHISKISKKRWEGHTKKSELRETKES